MSSRHDRLRRHGLDSPSGTIRAQERHEVLSALPATCERSRWVLEIGQELAR
jgi:hypothetical protein